MKRIFFADDDEDDSEIFKAALSNVVGEAEIHGVRNGAKLLQLLTVKIPPPPDYIFLDLNMPVKTGHDCLKEIRNNPFYKDLQVIILTTSRNQSDIDSTYQAGADYYICKTSSIKEFEKSLNKLFSFRFKVKPSKEEFVLN